jgi:hypothetical protein
MNALFDFFLSFVITSLQNFCGKERDFIGSLLNLSKYLFRQLLYEFNHLIRVFDI